MICKGNKLKHIIDFFDYLCKNQWIDLHLSAWEKAQRGEKIEKISPLN